MPKPKKGPRLGGSAAHQRHIIANLCKDLVRYQSVRTTQARAKTVQPHMERLITKAKKGDTHNRREILKVVQDREIAYILIEELAPLFEGREGGYTRITPVGNRKGDNAPMAVISLVTEAVTPRPKRDKPAAAVEAEEPAEDILDEVEEAAEEAEAEAEAEDEVADAAGEAVEDAEEAAEEAAEAVEAEADDVAAEAEEAADKAEEEAEEAEDDEAEAEK